MNRLHKYYATIIRVDLLMKDHYINVMELPQLNNITLNTGIGLKAILDKKQILNALLNMELISGQRPIITRAKKSIDKFKLREKMPVGCKVTLRKSNLYEFLDRFINIIIPFMDNSNDIFNSLYFKQFSNKQKFDSFSNISQLETLQEPNLKNNIFLHQDNTQKLYFKWTNNLYTLCTQNIRSKIWLDGSKKYNNVFLKKKMFVPKGLETPYLFNPLILNTCEASFLSNHTFICFNNFSEKFFKSKKNSFRLTSNVNSNSFNYYTIAFGFKDFISSTAFGTIFNCGQLDISYGLDIIFVVRYVKNQHLLQPHYFLSSFQLPL